MSNDELLQYFIKRTDERFDSVDNELKKLVAESNKRLGGAIVISALVSGFIAAASIYFGR